MIFDVFEYTNRGGRNCNEDSVAHIVNGNSAVFAVADGLGGHAYGELASTAVCDVLTQGWDGRFEEGQAAWISNKIVRANETILELMKEKNSVLKSTAVVLTVDGDNAVWANVGDSRLYFIHENMLKSYTNDHSVAYKKFKGGEITRNQIRTDEDQPALLRSVGSDDRNEPEIYPDVRLEGGDAFLLCSDGAWEYLQDEEIVIDMLKSRNAKEWAELLLLRILHRISENNDNLSIMTVMVS